jgi:NADPH:quinone reductase-like Zn-dependent oxidoreductase
MMKAIVQDRFGPPDVLEIREIDQPEVGDDEVLVRVHAASVNPADWYAMMGIPWVARPQMGLRKPKNDRPGLDLAGVVAAVGGNVTRFKPGDEVFGAGTGTLAEYAAAPEDALQLAKSLGAEVTGVCSTKNVDMVASLGADHVIDYTREDFTRTHRRYDLLVDVAGSRSWSACRRVLGPKATLVMVGAPKGNRLLGPLGHIVKVRVASLRASQRVTFFISKANNRDLGVLCGLLGAGTVTPVVERSYALGEAADALRYLGQGHAQGKLVIIV